MPAARRTIQDRGHWAQIEAPENAPSLLEDLPQSAPEMSDLFEQQRVREELTEVILGFLNATADKQSARDHERNLILALHGRYGQGKTRIVEELKAQIGNTMLCGKRWCRPLVVKDFRCSDYAPDDLQFNFDQLMESGRGLRSVFPALVIAAFITAWLSSSDFLRASVVDYAFAFFAVLAGTFAVPYRYLLRDAIRQFNLNLPLGTIMWTFADSVFRRADIVIVDDLDRAAPTQQTALLASLQRFKAEFSGVVLVVFDDSPLLESLETRVKAGEYITKVFHASFRLAPMNARDAGTMAADYGFALRRQNPNCPIARRFGEPLVCGALARVFHLHGTASARFSKKLVNNVYCAARVGRFTNEADIIALVRLHALLQSLPILEARLEVLAGSLLEASDTELFDHVASRFESALSTAQKSRISEFLARTAHMQPGRLNWLRQLRIWRSSSSESEIGPPAGWHDDWTRSWAIAEALLAGQRVPQERREEYLKLRIHTCRPPAHPELQASVRSSKLGQDQDDLVHDWRPVSATQLPDSMAKEYWLALISQVYLFDREVVALTPDETVSGILSDHRLKPLNTLYFSDTANFRLGSIGTIFRHSLLASDRLFDVRLGIELRALLQAKDQTRVIDNGLALSPWADQFDASCLDFAWPSFVDESTDRARNNFRLLGTLLRDFNRSRKVLPLAHRDWIEQKVRRGELSMVVEAICDALNFSSTTDGEVYWHEGFVRSLWDIDVLSSFDRKECSLVHTLISLGARREAPFWPLWLLALHGDAQRVAESLIPVWGGISLPGPSTLNSSFPDWFEAIEALSEHWPELRQELQEWVERSAQ